MMTRQPLREELATLPFLCLPVRAAIEAWADAEVEGRAQAVRIFVEMYLPRLHVLGDYCASPGMRDLCLAFEEISEAPVIIEVLGGREAVPWLEEHGLSQVWSRLRQTVSNPVHLEYCYLNETAMASIAIKPGPILDLVWLEPVILTLRARGDNKGILEEAARFYRFGEPPWDSCHWEELVVRWGFPPSGNPLILNPLAMFGAALTHLRRHEEAIPLFEVLLDIRGLDEPAPSAESLAERIDARIARLEQTLRDDLPEADLPEKQFHFYRAMLFRMTAEWVANAADAYSARGDKERALQLLAGFLRLPPLNISELQGFDKRRRLGAEQRWSLFSRKWASLVIETGHLAEVITRLSPLLDAATWRGQASDSAAMLTEALISDLADREQPEECITLALKLLGLSLDLVHSSEVLRCYDLPLHHVEPHLATAVLSVLVTTFFCLGDTLAVTNLAESVWLIDPLEDYRDAALLRQRLAQVWLGDRPTTLAELNTLNYLAFAHLTQGRFVAAYCVVQTLLPNAPDFTDARFSDLQKATSELPAPSRGLFIASWCRVNLFPYPQQVFVILFEGLGLTLEDFDDPENARLKLGTARKALSEMVFFQFVDLVFRAVRDNTADDPRTAALLRLGEYVLGLPTCWDGSTIELPASPEWYQEVAIVFRVTNAVNLCREYATVGRHDLALALCGLVFGLGPEHFRRIGGIRTCLGALPLVPIIVSELYAELFPLLMHFLKESGRFDDLEALYQSQIASLDWIDVEDYRMSPLVCAEMAHAVLTAFAERHPELVFPLGYRFLDYFRKRLLRSVISQQDRRLLLLNTARFRRELLRQGNTVVNSPEERIRLLLLDQNLGQCWLLERLRMTLPRSNEATPLEPSEVWQPAPMETPSLVASLTCFSQTMPEISETILCRDEDNPDPGPKTEPWFDPDAATEDHLASTLGDNERFLRGGFTNDGRLTWTLYERDHPDLFAPARLKIVASDEGRHRPGQRDTIEKAIADHDLTVETIWERFRWDQTYQKFEKSEAYDDFMQAIDEGEYHHAVRFLVPQGREFANEYPLLHQRLLEHPVLVCLFSEAHPDDSVSIAEAWVAWMQNWILQSTELEPALENATRTFLTTIGEIWDLQPLADHLTEDNDLTVQFDDVLHGVPPAFLPIGQGRFLVETVKSVRVVFSLLQSEQLRTIEDRIVREQPGWIDNQEPRRTLSLSWFHDFDHAGRAAGDLLHLGHRSVVEPLTNAGYRGTTAALNPTGSHATLAGLLAHGDPVQVAIVCGHGTCCNERMAALVEGWTGAGVMLFDGVWSGSELINPSRRCREPACDLAQIEFLIFVSCLVGRSAHSQVRGVEGFCVELTASRARSVLAGIWWLHSNNAVAFARAVLKEYLEQREKDRKRNPDPEWWPSARLRARVVAEVQRHWLKESRTTRVNTLAAFVVFNQA